MAVRPYLLEAAAKPKPGCQEPQTSVRKFCGRRLQLAGLQRLVSFLFNCSPLRRPRVQVTRMCDPDPNTYRCFLITAQFHGPYVSNRQYKQVKGSPGSVLRYIQLSRCLQNTAVTRWNSVETAKRLLKLFLTTGQRRHLAFCNKRYQILSQGPP